MATEQHRSPMRDSIRLMPQPLGYYVRGRREDKAFLLDLIASRLTNFSGIVFEPYRVKQDRELRELVLKQHLDAILDPKTQQLATPGGFSPTLGSLPWGGERPHSIEDFIGTNARRRVAEIAAFADELGFSQVIAPTHVIKSAEDPWLTIDVDAVRRFREELDRINATRVGIILDLAVSYSAFRSPQQREEIIRLLEGLPINQVWLKVDGLGRNATPTGVRNYIEAARDFHELELPILADHFGGVPGLTLLALGAVSGLVQGVTLAEQFDSNAWMKPRSSDGFSLRHRVYFPGLDLNLSAEQAREILNSSTRARALLGCHDRNCCERNVSDMVQNAGRHFVYQRIREVSTLSRMPESVRAREFVEGQLRQVTESLIKASSLQFKDHLVLNRIMAQRKRLDALRVMLMRQLSQEMSRSTAIPLGTRSTREARLT